MKNHPKSPTCCKKLSTLSPSLLPWNPFSSKISPSPSPHHHLFNSKSHFHKRLEKVERFHSKFWKNLLEEAPPLAMGQPMVLFNPISIHVGVNIINTLALYNAKITIYWPISLHIAW
jgi:hypothetical protein